MNQSTNNQIFNFEPTLVFTSVISLSIFILSSFSLNAQSRSKGFSRVEPPHWFTDMPEANLEILIHQKNIAENNFSLGQGSNNLTIKEVKRLPNPNYVILSIDIPTGTEAQKLDIISKGKAGKFKHTYKLKERKPYGRGLDGSDIIYLITPDRFANGDTSNDSFADMNQTTINRSEPYERHGGDIAGIIANLDYIENLGMTAIWPNPLLENDQPHESYHGYAFTDYYNIDKRFGSNELFGVLVDSLHSRNMKMVMDVVYNHIGNEHHLFTDIPDSSWFHFHPEYTRTNYRAPVLMDIHASAYDKDIMTDGWFDKHMPDLNQKNPDLAQYLIQQTIWWIEEYQIDALRIDTYAYPDQEFMRDWGEAVKTAFPDIFLFAETWVHGTPVQAWFLGDALGPEENHLDGLTDFQVYYAINDALTKDQGWADGIAKLYYTLAADYVYADPNKMVTFLDNHDLARFLGYMNKDLRKYEIGMGMLFTLRGIPSIYYGTEILMSETDGHGKIRQDFPGGWPNDTINKFTAQDRTPEENRAYDLISSLSEFRKSHPALIDGKLTQFVPQDGVYVYFRHLGDDMVMVAINTSQEPKTTKAEKYREFLEGKKAIKPFDGSELPIPSSFELEPMSILIMEVY